MKAHIVKDKKGQIICIYEDAGGDSPKVSPFIYEGDYTETMDIS